MKKMILTAAMVFGLVIGGFASGDAQAATVNLSTDLTPSYKTVHGVRANTNTSTLDLLGMSIAVNYAGGTQDSLSWSRLSPWRGGLPKSAPIGLRYANFGLSLFTSTRIASIGFNLAPANAFFDILPLSEGKIGNTPGSKNGRAFKITSGDLNDSDSITANFSSLLFVAGQARGIDAFTNLLIDFSGVRGGGLLGNFSFAVDTDSLAVPGDLTPVPLPNSLLLLLAAISALALLRCRTSRRTSTGVASA